MFSRLTAICDAEACARAGWAIVDFADACMQGGATFLQVRAKSRPSGWFLDVAAQIVRKANPAGARVIVNDRADIAWMSGANGVHVGQEDLRPEAVRRVVGATAILGLSTHTMQQLEQAAGEPIDYLAIGPVFATASKETGYAAVGLERVGQAHAIAARSGLPVVAIGGITLALAPSVIQAGASSVAVIGDLFATGDPERRVREYLEVLGSV